MWSLVGPEEVARKRMKQVAYACRYGKAGLLDAMSVDLSVLMEFISAVAEIVEEEKPRT